MERKKLLNTLKIFFFLVILGFGVYYLLNADKQYQNKEKARVTYHNFSGYIKEREALEGFISKYFIDDGFMRTNLVETDQGESASGADFLSESAGLLMLYYLSRDKREEFDDQVNILLTHFQNRNQLIKWRIRHGQNRETVNATIDDLRIVKALLRAAEKWGRNDYKSFAEHLSAQLLKHCITKNNLKAYDSSNSPQAPWVYYDFEAMRQMGVFDRKWNELAAVNLKNILSRQVKGLPLYQDNQMPKDNMFPTVENLLIMMHLSEVGVKDPQSIAWLKDQLKGKGLFGSYSIEGKPLNTVESPAIYGITAIIARLYGDQELYDLAAAKLKKMQNMIHNEYYGGFIDLKRLSAFSFDQLFSLLAY